MLISLPSILNWIHHHVLISLGIVLLAALVIWGVGPASFAVTHINMQHCGSLYSALGPQPAGGKVNNQAVRAIDCFVLAHQQCVAASLSYSTHSLDTGTQDTYYTSNSLGGCGLSGHTSSYVEFYREAAAISVVVAFSNTLMDYTSSPADGLESRSSLFRPVCR
jgi:hypothetical protein